MMAPSVVFLHGLTDTILTWSAAATEYLLTQPKLIYAGHVRIIGQGLLTDLGPIIATVEV